MAKGSATQRGFTLVELLIAICILGVLMLVAVPAFTDAILSQKLSGMTNSFSASVQIARSEAIKRNASSAKPVKMCRSTDGVNCAGSGGWDQGWIVFNDNDNDGVLDSDETLVYRQTAIANGFHLTGDVYSLTFVGTGVTGDNAGHAFKVCRYSPSIGGQDRSVGVSVTGRITISTTATGVCNSA
jgi:type IV fimbrial biogenesis protein FimT